MIPASVVSNILQERESNVKHQQLISGLNLGSYWTAMLVFDIFKVYVPVLLSLALIYLFNQDVIA